MKTYSISDQARAIAMRSASARLRTTLATLTDELSTGRVSDVAQRVNGNLRQVHHIESKVATLAQFRLNAAEAAGIAERMQLALQTVQDASHDLGLSLIADYGGQSDALDRARGDSAAKTLQQAIETLNSDEAGASLFGGTATDRKPLISSDTMLDHLTAATAGATTAADIATTVNAWFDAPPGAGGFLDLGYQGSIGQSRVTELGDGVTVQFATTAATPAVRDALRGIAMMALVSRGALAGDSVETARLMHSAGTMLVRNNDALTAERGRVGLLEQAIARAQSANSAENAVFQKARTELLQADPYETATAITEIETQIQSIYAVTARLSNLKLVNYLR